MSIEKNFHGLPCNCYSRLVLLGILPDPNASTCPTLCGTDVTILGTSDNYTVDGWYLQVDASNLVYMDADGIVETVACGSGIAQLVIEVIQSSFNLNAVFSAGAWVYMADASVSDSGLDHTFNIQLNFSDGLNNQLQVSYDGTTWTTVYSTDSNNINTVYTAVDHNFRWRVLNYYEECPYYLGTSLGVCPFIKSDTWQYAVSSSDTLSTVGIYPTIDSSADSYQLNLQTSIDSGTTWVTQQTNIPFASFDGLTRIDTNLAPSDLPFITRIELTSTLGCVNYSDNAPIF